MKKKVWRTFCKDLNILDEPKLLVHKDKKEIQRLIQKDVNLQVTWIMVRSCKGISCKDCYISDVCKTKKVCDSQILAGAIVKSIQRKGEKDADSTTGKV